MGILDAFSAFFSELAKGRGVPVVGGPGTGIPVVNNVAEPPKPSEVPIAQLTQAFLGPGVPFTPFGAGADQGQRDKVRAVEPRSFQYMPNSNIVITPRIGYNLTPFADLKMYAESVPEVSMCLRLLTEEMKAFVPTIKDKNSKVITEDDQYYDQLSWMVETPDRYNDWPDWLSRYMYDLLVFDASAVYYVRDNPDNLETVTALRVIDGSTLVLLIDERGEPPAPPAPAFTQIIQGTPLQWYDTRQIRYRPRHKRIDAPYGRSPVEDSLPAVITLSKLWQTQMAWYTEGNIPELVFTAPGNYDVEKCIELERSINDRMSGSPEERARVRVVPSGTEVLQTKDAHFDVDVYDKSTNAVRMSFGIVQSEVGDAPGEGLGGKGYAEAMQSNFYRMGLAPIKSHLEALYRNVLKINGFSKIGYKWSLEFPSETIDPSKEEEKWMTRFEKTLVQRDEAREGVKMQPLGGEEGKAFYADPGAESGMGDLGDGKIGVTGGSDDSSGDSSGPGGGHHPLFSNTIPIATGSGGSHISVTGGKVKVGNGHGKIKVQKVLPSGLLQKVAEDHSTDVMVALYFPDEVNKQLVEAIKKLPDGSNALQQADMHVTLGYMGEIADLPFSKEELDAVCTEYCSKHPFITGDINGVGRFLDTHREGMDAIYANFDSPDLPGFRQGLAELLEQRGLPMKEDHGFTPHVTLAYVLDGEEVKNLEDFPVIKGITIKDVTISWGDEQMPCQLVDLPRDSKEPINKAVNEHLLGLLAPGALQKHCGVCAEDDAYFGVRATKPEDAPFPRQGANAMEIVSLRAAGLEPRAALWKPVSGEKSILQDRIGGMQAYREEAFYLLDRGFNDQEHYLVPVAYVTTIDDELGAVLMYVRGRDFSKNVTEYSADYTWRAACEDFIGGSLDRHVGNWLTHPDEDDRPILIDNGLSFPDEEGHHFKSEFINLWKGKSLPEESKDCLYSLLGNVAFWRDLALCTGKSAADSAKERAKLLYETGVIPDDSSGSVPMSGEIPVVGGNSKSTDGSTGTEDMTSVISKT